MMDERPVSRFEKGVRMKWKWRPNRRWRRDVDRADRSNHTNAHFDMAKLWGCVLSISPLASDVIDFCVTNKRFSNHWMIDHRRLFLKYHSLYFVKGYCWNCLFHKHQISYTCGVFLFAFVSPPYFSLYAWHVDIVVDLIYHLVSSFSPFSYLSPVPWFSAALTILLAHNFGHISTKTTQQPPLGLLHLSMAHSAGYPSPLVFSSIAGPSYTCRCH